MELTDQEALERARVRVHRRRELYIHAAIFAVVMGGLALLNWAMTPTFWWVLFPTIGWGIGLAAHATSVLFEDSLFGPEWEARKTQELLERRR